MSSLLITLNNLYKEEMINLFFNKKADFSDKNRKGMSPLMIALSSFNKFRINIIKLLIN